ncbi:hypothetical protein KTH05_15450 [Acinetobacter lactucae]|uniref:hypothetical protein n=1 Tax=Acinetobacter lactucae TaxID=1785128 RepID=UPI0021CDA26B|nr:hypothetical protein [Acinetobacter lactucae]MCU4349139.1 hypothetical protein [Acinetobacter lactucae]
MFLKHNFYRKKVVFKYPIKNETCFMFISACELLGLIRLATKEEEILRKRLNKYEDIEEYWLDEFKVNR